MRNIFPIGCFGIWFIVAVFVGCTTTSQRTAFNTISSVEASATAAMDGYDAWAISTMKTNSVPQVSKAYNDLQAALKLAAAADQAGTNGLAPTALEVDFTNLVNLINTAKK